MKNLETFKEYYEILDTGVIHQKKIFFELQKYDFDYVNLRYNSYGELCDKISYLRYGFLIGSIKKIPSSILDVGYGNGSFLNVSKNTIKKCYGNDISKYDLPPNVEFINNIFENYYDVICFFDVLEHFNDINEISKLKCEYIYISVPECHFFDIDSFWNWKHRRPDEHLWHFNLNSITKFFKKHNFELVSHSNVEDIIRKPINEYSNILTCVFKKH